MYTIKKDQQITNDFITRIISNFQVQELPYLNKCRNYYDGKQDILKKVATDTGKPCNHVIVNYCKTITDNFNGYITGLPITYENDDFQEILDILDYNDIEEEDNELLRQALIYGISYEINYLDQDSIQRFNVLDSRSCIPVYSDTVENELLYVIRFWQEWSVIDNQFNYHVEVYGPDYVRRYKALEGFNYIELISEEPNYYGQCQITVFPLNEDRKSIFHDIFSLQDAYNELLSSEVDDFDAFADAYLLIKGCVADEDDLKAMKEHRCLCLDPDCDAKYITKNINDTQIKDMLDNVNDKIHVVSGCPDFTDEKFFNSSGIALKYKLLSFENIASNVEKQMKKALMRRIELLMTINNIKEDTEQSLWVATKIQFKRNLPSDLSDTVQIVNSLRGIVSQRTLLSLLPFIKDVDKEIETVQEERTEQLEMYSMQNIDEEDREDNQE